MVLAEENVVKDGKPTANNNFLQFKKFSLFGGGNNGHKNQKRKVTGHAKPDVPVKPDTLRVGDKANKGDTKTASGSKAVNNVNEQGKSLRSTSSVEGKPNKKGGKMGNKNGSYNLGHTPPPVPEDMSCDENGERVSKIHKSIASYYMQCNNE